MNIEPSIPGNKYLLIIHDHDKPKSEEHASYKYISEEDYQILTTDPAAIVIVDEVQYWAVNQKAAKVGRVRIISIDVIKKKIYDKEDPKTEGLPECENREVRQ